MGESKKNNILFAPSSWQIIIQRSWKMWANIGNDWNVTAESILWWRFFFLQYTKCNIILGTHFVHGIPARCDERSNFLKNLVATLKSMYCSALQQTIKDFFWLDINQTTIIWQCTQAINSLCLSESLYRVHWSDCMAQDINGQCGLFPDSFFIPPVSHLDPFCEYNVNGCNFEISSADAACSSAQWMECRGGNVAKKQCE